MGSVIYVDADFASRDLPDIPLCYSAKPMKCTAFTTYIGICVYPLWRVLLVLMMILYAKNHAKFHSWFSWMTPSMMSSYPMLRGHTLGLERNLVSLLWASSCPWSGGIVKFLMARLATCSWLLVSSSFSRSSVSYATNTILGFMGQWTTSWLVEHNGSKHKLNLLYEQHKQ